MPADSQDTPSGSLCRTYSENVAELNSPNELSQPRSRKFSLEEIDFSPGSDELTSPSSDTSSFLQSNDESDMSSSFLPLSDDEKAGPFFSVKPARQGPTRSTLLLAPGP